MNHLLQNLEAKAGNQHCHLLIIIDVHRQDLEAKAGGEHFPVQDEVHQQETLAHFVSWEEYHLPSAVGSWGASNVWNKVAQKSAGGHRIAYEQNAYTVSKKKVWWTKIEEILDRWTTEYSI